MIIKKQLNLNEKICLPIFITHSDIDGFDLHVNMDTPSWIITDEIGTIILNSLKMGNSLEKSLEPIKDKEKALLSLRKLLLQIFENNFFENAKSKKLWSERKLGFFITNYCNYNCKHCYIEEKGNIFLDKEVIIDKVTELKKYGFNDFYFLGAEPMAHPDFFTILEGIKKLDFRVNLLTNGSYIKDIDTVKFIKNNVDSIQISMDGATEEVHNYIRGKNSYKDVITAIELLRKENIYPEIASIIFEENQDDFLNNIDILLNSLDKNNKIIVDRGFELGNAKNLHITSEEIVNQIRQNIIKKGYNTEATKAVHYKKFNCGYGEDLVVQANGDVCYCIKLKETKFANIFVDDIKTIIQKLDQGRNSTNVDNIPFCKNCDVKYVCGGACYVSESDNLSENTTHCNKRDSIYKELVRINRIQMEEAEGLTSQ